MAGENQQLTIGTEVLAVKIWKKHGAFQHWDRPRRGRVIAINMMTEHGIIVEFGEGQNAQHIGFEPVEVWPADTQ